MVRANWGRIFAIVYLFMLCYAPQVASSTSQNNVIIAVTQLPENFSPYANSPLSLSYAHLFFDPLVRWGINGKLEKRLLRDWRVIKPGVIRFYLKNNIYFHSGNRLTSNDVLWSYAQIKKRD